MPFVHQGDIDISSERIRAAGRKIVNEIGVGWPLAGLVASGALAALSPASLVRFDGPAVSWWYLLTGATGWGRTFATAGGYVAIGVLVTCWLAVARRIRGRKGPAWPLWITAAAWSIPLAAGPPLFSRDIYSYVAQSALADLHLSPYLHGASALYGTGSAGLVAAVAPVWRHSLSPYGPLFLWLGSVIIDTVGHSLIGAVMIMRLPEVVGVVLIAVFLPRLARAAGADGRMALWLGAFSPLVLFDFVAAGHNDGLMVGLLVAAIALAVDRHPLAAAVVCAVAVTVKLPAMVGCVAVLVAWMRSQSDRRASQRALVVTSIVILLVVATISSLTGLGFGWLKPAVLLTPSAGSIVVTPATAFGKTLAPLAHLLGWPLHARTLTAWIWPGLIAIAGAVGLAVLRRCRMENLGRSVATIMLALAVSAPALWPWYLAWSFCLLAALPSIQRSSALLVATVGACALLAPTGEIMLPAGAAPIVALTWSGLAIAAVRLARRRDPPPPWDGVRPTQLLGSGVPD